jgi:hypothetical protein
MPGNYQYAEGGGPLPPYKESFLENIVAVSWRTEGSGGVFVSGDRCCFQRCCTLEQRESKQKWTAIGALAFGPGGGTTASSYGLTRAGPVFLVGGHSGESEPILMRSQDGKKWSQVGAATAMAEFNIDQLVWDAEERRFYLQGDGEGMRSFYSPDGLVWYFSRSSFESHCKGPLGGPDGVYGFDQYNDLIIAPDGSGGAVAIQGKKTFRISVGLAQCNCVAYVGGVWMAGGAAIEAIPTSTMASATTSSIDGGKTWHVSTYGDLSMEGGDPSPGFEITTMVAAPIRDFKR